MRVGVEAVGQLDSAEVVALLRQYCGNACMCPINMQPACAQLSISNRSADCLLLSLAIRVSAAKFGMPCHAYAQSANQRGLRLVPKKARDCRQHL